MSRLLSSRSPQLTLSLSVLAGCLAILSWTGGCSSSKASTIDPFSMADEARSPADLLDEPQAAARSQRGTGRRGSPGAGRAQFSVPQAAAEPARQIDATPQGWDLSQLRHFDQRFNLVEGVGAWRGTEDASFSVAVEFDESHLYFWIQVQDDQIIRSHPSTPLEGVLIWLGDPGLDGLFDSLPENLVNQLSPLSHSAILISPDGQFGRYGDGPIPSDNSVHVATAYTDTGYIVEAAFSLEAFALLTELPLNEVAFRVEILDTDDPQSPSYQKRLSMFPPRDDGKPRYALLDVEGLLPLVSPVEGPPRADALGVWRQSRDGWRFETMEYVSPHWEVIEDLQAAAAQVVDRGPLPTVCTGPDKAMWLVEAYESIAGNQRVALILCGTDNLSAFCPANAVTQLVWTAMKSIDDDAWVIDQVQELFPEPLGQCPFQSRAAQPYFHSFSMLPLGVIGPTVWGIGWHMQQQASHRNLERAGVYFVDPRSEHFIVGDLPLRHIADHGPNRTRHDSRVYLTDLNDDDAMDLCEIELVQDQYCPSSDQPCETRERGREVLTHIKTWVDSEYRFEDYLLHRHDRCRGSTTFAEISGYKVLLVEKRLGLIRSARSPR